MKKNKDPWMKKAKWLTQSLIISCTLNVGLLSTFMYFALSENRETVSKKNIPFSPAENLNLQEVFTKYSALSFQDLLLRLSNKDLVENGCTCRDVALACLVAFHHFHLERALGGITLQKREISYLPPYASSDIHLGKMPTTFTFFPGLSEYQFQAIVHYAKTEKWPLTSEGLFLELKKAIPPYDPTLMESIYLTPEFHYISLLFSKTGVHLKKEYIATLLSHCNWPVVMETTEHLRFNTEFTSEERRYFLLRLVEQESKIAAKILLEMDQEYCYKYLSNEQILLLCSLLKDKTPPAFLKALLESPRLESSGGEEIWKMAATILYDQAAEELPKELSLNEAKSRFIHLKAPSKTPTTMPSSTIARQSPFKPSQRTYTVKTGDSLWKIAREQKTTVQALREINNIQTDKLKTGQTLILP